MLRPEASCGLTARLFHCLHVGLAAKRHGDCRSAVITWLSSAAAAAAVSDRSPPLLPEAPVPAPDLTACQTKLASLTQLALTRPCCSVHSPDAVRRIVESGAKQTGPGKPVAGTTGAYPYRARRCHSPARQCWLRSRRCCCPPSSRSGTTTRKAVAAGSCPCRRRRRRRRRHPRLHAGQAAA